MKIIDKILLTVAIICGSLIIVQWSLFVLAQQRLNTIINEVTSNETIENADGPTAIFVSKAESGFSIILLTLMYIALLLSLGFLVVRKIQRNRRN